MGGFETRLTPDGPGRLVLSLIGDLDAAAVPLFDAAIAALLAPGRLIVLDGVQLRSLDPDGLRELAAAAARARAAGAEIRLVVTRRDVREVLSMLESASDAQPPIANYPSVDAALTS
jgi:anti-anti-sigma factor